MPRIEKTKNKRKQKTTKKNLHPFEKIDRAQAPIVVAQGFRARMNNFPSSLIEVLNTVQVT